MEAFLEDVGRLKGPWAYVQEPTSETSQVDEAQGEDGETGQSHEDSMAAEGDGPSGETFEESIRLPVSQEY